MQRDFPLRPTERLAEAAARVLDGPSPGAAEVVPARPAATVLLLRDGSSGPEVFMIHRVASMAFAPSVHVFPGGGVDPADADPRIRLVGPSADQWAQRLGTTPEAARGLVVAVVRELFEETGVLLAGPGSSALADPADPALAGARDALAGRETTVADLLSAHGYAVRADLLSYRAHWTTPTFEPRRYDTHFFAARLPDGQVADDATSEAQAAGWVRPADLLGQGATGAAILMPPTIVCLESVRDAPSVAAFLAVEPEVREVIPVVVRAGDGYAVRADLP